MTDLTMYRGDTAKFDFTIALAGAPVDLSYVELTFTAKADLRDPDSQALIVKSLGLGLEATDAVNGEVRLTIDPDDTIDFAGTMYVLPWDIELIDEDASVHTVADGRLIVKPEATRGTGS